MPLGFQPKKRLGQNFLHDGKTLEKICSAANLEETDEVLEIGPGLGTLTRFLLPKCAKVIAVEKDSGLVEAFPAEIISDEKFVLIEGDVMKTGLERFYSGRPLKMVSNLPYGISSGVLRMLTRSRRLFSLAVIMLQKEVALRIVASPGTRTYGSLSANIQMMFNAEKLFDVPPGLFTPRPAVTSSVVRLTPLEQTRFPVKSEEFYQKTVRAAFSGRRKMVKNSLCSVFPGDRVESVLEAVSVDGRRRAETLGLEEFSLISDKLLETLADKK